ncbi:hypothetical protein KJ628_05965 [Patescibacteria group bacterium]|nr:hypothetical protein [Patescibacteria group bacterium]
MIDEQRRFNLPTVDGGELEVEINWSEDPDVKDCKTLRFHDKANDRTFSIKRDDLVTLLLVVGDAKTQKDLMPIQVRKVRRIERLLHGTIKAKKNYTRGDSIEFTVPWIDEIPIDDEVLSGNMPGSKSKIIT